MIGASATFVVGGVLLIALAMMAAERGHLPLVIGRGIVGGVFLNTGLIFFLLTIHEIVNRKEERGSQNEES